MRLVVALDYSDSSAMACRWALARLAGLGVEALTFVHVLDGNDRALGAIEKATRELRRFVEALVESPIPESVEVRYSVVHGKPAAEVLAAASAQKADAVLMGTNSRSGLDRLLLGSVAETVVRGAACTVIVVKPGPR